MHTRLTTGKQRHKWARVHVGCPIVANLYMQSFERKALGSANNPPGHGLGLWMTCGSSNNRHINRNFWIISIM